MPRRWLLAIALVLAPAAAFADGEQAFSVETGYATFTTPGKKVGTMEPPALSPDYGWSLALVYERELSSDLMVRGEGVGAMFSGGNLAKQTSSSYAGLVDVGVLFRFDVLRDVPYAFGGVGAVVSGGGPIDRGEDFVVVVGGGLDWLQSRKRSYGFEGRLASFGGNITVFTFGVRGTCRWGFF
jgi:hypothetical protein